MHIPRLDLMIAYSCNLQCAGCISLSDFKRDGIESFDNIKKYIDDWKDRISPAVVTLFGGEPCLHPRLQDICKYVHNAWPDCTMRLITNGYLLDNFDSAEWFNFPKFEIQISIHIKDQEYIINKKIKNILSHSKNWKVKQNTDQANHKQFSWSLPNITIYKSVFKDFVVPFKLVNNKISFWASDYKQAHAICGSPNTPVLHKGFLYKCPPVANIFDLTKETFANYSGIPATVTDEALQEFVNNIGKPEHVCGQCPDRSQAIIVDHMDLKNVINKQKNIN